MEYTDYIHEYCKKHITTRERQDIFFFNGKESYLPNKNRFEMSSYYDYKTNDRFDTFEQLVVHAKKQV